MEQQGHACSDKTEDSRIEGYRRIRAMGLPKPADAPQDVWDAAGPYTPESALEVTRMALQHRAIEKAQEPLPKDEKAMVRQLFPQAVIVHHDVMTNPGAKDQDKLAAARFIAEHTIGKAEQKVEHSGSLALEVHNQLEKLVRDIKSGTVIDTQNLLANEPSPVDDFLEKHRAKKFIVGRKVAPDEPQESKQPTEGLPERTSDAP